MRASSLLFVPLILFFVSVRCQIDQSFFRNADPWILAKLSQIPSLREDGPLAIPPRYNLAECPSIPIPPDTDNVNNLRPGNIKVVMAMGDSISCGSSAKDTSIFSLKEYRGLAFSIGADPGVTTMPNILKAYTAPLIGPSTGIGKRDMATNGLNGAVSGSINVDMVEQAKWLVAQMKANPNINMDQDWKMVTIWIGSNNLCDICENLVNNDAENFKQYVTEALEYLYANVARVFVNLVLNLDITQLDKFKDSSCSFVQSIACACVGKNRALVLKNNLEYQSMAYTIAETFASRNNPQFAVVVQPFLKNTIVDKRNELSAADCFHPSALSHAVASVALWNNMISPAAQKQLSWNFTESPKCATEDTLLYIN